MEFVVLAVVGFGVFLWWLGRAPSQPAPPAGGRYGAAPGVAAASAVPLTHEVLRRATDPDDPDGAFMDGYVAGRYTERWSADEAKPDTTGTWRERDHNALDDDDSRYDVHADDDWDD